MKLKIAMIGRRAQDYALDFTDQDCRIIQMPQEIVTQDDLVFCHSLEQLIPAEILKVPRYGIWVTHSSDLPQGRGWAPLQWSVIKKLPHVTVTLFKASTGIDDGPWAFKRRFPISQIDTIDDLYKKDHDVCVDMYRRLISAVVAGTLELHEQVGESSTWRRRRPEDSELDSTMKLSELWDHIRVCDNERYPAFFMVGDRKVILRYEVEKPQ